MKNHQDVIINNRLSFNLQQRFKSARYNNFTEEIHKIALSSNDDKRIQSISLVEPFACIQNKKDLIRKKEEIKCSNTIKQHKNGQL